MLKLMLWTYLMILCIIPMILFSLFFMLTMNSNKINPLFMLLFFLIYVLCSGFMIYLLESISIYSLIVMMVFMGGIMVLFTYFVSLINELFYYKLLNNYNMIIFFMLLMIMMSEMILLKDYSLENIYFNDSVFAPNSMNILYIYFELNIFILSLLMLFLFYILYMSMSMCLIKKKSLRKLVK